jgi:hypothetical protein
VLGRELLDLGQDAKRIGEVVISVGSCALRFAP